MNMHSTGERRIAAAMALAAVVGLCGPAGAGTPTDYGLTQLHSKDPNRPLVVIGDAVWNGPNLAVAAQDADRKTNQLHTLQVGSYTVKEGQGTAKLVIDYVGVLKPGLSKGSASVDIGIECPGAAQPCTYPITTSVMVFESRYMVPVQIPIDGTPTSVLVGRDSYQYLFPEGNEVNVSLSLLASEGIEPKAIRARLLFGDPDLPPLPGQTTRSTRTVTIAGVLLGLLLLLYRWVKR